MTAVNYDSRASGNPILNSLKRVYVSRPPELTWKQKHALLDHLPKMKAFEGEPGYWIWNIDYDHAAVSQNFAQALANRRPGSTIKFGTDAADIYSVAQFDAKTLRRARSNVGAFADTLESAYTNHMSAVIKRLAWGIYRNDNGYLATLSSVTAGSSYVTLTNRRDVYAFSVGAMLEFDDTATGASPKAETGADNFTITKIDAVNGRLYLTGIDGATNIAASDYVFILGDSKTNQASFLGLESYFPATVSSGESFSSTAVDRSAMRTRLAGHYLDGTSMALDDAIQEMLHEISYTSNGACTGIYMAPANMNVLARLCDAQVVRDPLGKGGIGYSGFEFASGVQGNVTVYGDPACQSTDVWCLDTNSMALGHLTDDLCEIVTDGNDRLDRVYNADSVEARFRSWCNLAVFAPGNNGHILVNAPA